MLEVRGERQLFVKRPLVAKSVARYKCCSVSIAIFRDVFHNFTTLKGMLPVQLVVNIAVVGSFVLLEPDTFKPYFNDVNVNASSPTDQGKYRHRNPIPPHIYIHT